MIYNKAGYYLIKPRIIDFGSFKGQKILTCSTCLNDSLLDNFSRPWTIHNTNKEDAMKEYNISEETISSIHKWTDEMDSSNMIGYMNLFYSIETAKEYKNCFFSHLDETLILGLYFPIRESQEFVDCFEPKGKNEGEIGLRYKLKQYQPDDDTGILLGFDLIGVEIGGEFHSFHCHDLANDLIERFDIAINEFGLIQNEKKWEAIIDYMNDESNGFEPVPWFFVQVKLFN